MKIENELLVKASATIKTLRTENNIMSARLRMFDQCMQLANAEPQRHGMSNGMDIVYDIDKFIEASAAQPEKKK